MVNHITNLSKSSKETGSLEYIGKTNFEEIRSAFATVAKNELYDGGEKKFQKIRKPIKGDKAKKTLSLTVIPELDKITPHHINLHIKDPNKDPNQPDYVVMLFLDSEHDHKNALHVTIRTYDDQEQLHFYPDRNDKMHIGDYEKWLTALNVMATNLLILSNVEFKARGLS